MNCVGLKGDRLANMDLDLDSGLAMKISFTKESE